ncbi:hypothetical protein RhiTH_011147 [Rhizoctonia solani]
MNQTVHLPREYPTAQYGNNPSESTDWLLCLGLRELKSTLLAYHPVQSTTSEKSSVYHVPRPQRSTPVANTQISIFVGPPQLSSIPLGYYIQKGKFEELAAPRTQKCQS